MSNGPNIHLSGDLDDTRAIVASVSGLTVSSACTLRDGKIDAASKRT